MKNVRKVLGIDRLHQMGIRGAGVGVAVLDSGVADHPDLTRRMVEFRDFVNGRHNPYDDEGHGTHVAGIVAGDGRASRGMMRGIAPEAHLVALKVLDERGIGKEETVIEGIRWIIDNGRRFRIRVVNISFGTFGRTGQEYSRLVEMVELLWDLGYVVVAAAGNNGPENYTIATPGDSRKVLTVGAANDNVRMIVNGKVTRNYSGRGPTFECVQKPDVVAPANGIYSCCNRWKKYSYYIPKSGTSMATPIVTGAICLLLGEHTELSNVACKRLIKSTATDLKLDGNRQGWGMIHPQKMMNL